MLLRRVPQRFHAITDEVAKFGTIGLINLGVNFAVFNLLLLIVAGSEVKAKAAATVVAVTGDPGSALARLADVVLTVAAGGTTFREGPFAARHAQLLVVDCLYVRVAQLTFTRASAVRALTDHIPGDHAVPTSRRRAPERASTSGMRKPSPISISFFEARAVTNQRSAPETRFSVAIGRDTRRPSARRVVNIDMPMSSIMW